MTIFKRSNYFLVALVLLLSSCQVPPPAEVKGVCRSCKPYQIKGVWYYPQNHYQYKEVGIASWYGPKCHLKKKANGEQYNQHHISVAHKELPLPTVVKITNLENGKSLVAVVDDRGPFVKGRIVDLSLGAAQALDVYKKGLATVKVEALEEESHKFAMHLLKYKGGIEKNGRSWNAIYFQDILKTPLYASKPLQRMKKTQLLQKVKRPLLRREAACLDHLISGSLNRY